MYRVGQKASPQYSRHNFIHYIQVDFQNSFTVTFSGKFAIKRSLNIPPHLKHISTLRHYPVK